MQLQQSALPVDEAAGVGIRSRVRADPAALRVAVRARRRRRRPRPNEAGRIALRGDGEWQMPGGERVTMSPDPTSGRTSTGAARGFSGTAVYRHEFTLTGCRSAAPTAALEFDDVRDIARVRRQRRRLRHRVDRAFPGRRDRRAARRPERPRGARRDAVAQPPDRRGGAGRSGEIFAPMTAVFEPTADTAAGRNPRDGSADHDDLIFGGFAVASGSVTLLPHISDCYVGMMQMVRQWMHGPRSRVSCTADDNDVTKGSICHSSPADASGGRSSRSRSPAPWSSPGAPARPTTTPTTAATPATTRSPASRSWSRRPTTPTTTTRRWPRRTPTRPASRSR